MVGRITLALAVVVLAGCTKVERGPAPLPAAPVKEQKIAALLTAYHSPHPTELARVIVKMKRPRLAVAQAIVESNGDKTAVGKAGEQGIWQVMKKDWGPVPADIQGQANQYEVIMEELIRASDGNLRRALGRYNGDKSGKYAAKVMKVVSQVPL